MHRVYCTIEEISESEEHHLKLGIRCCAMEKRGMFSTKRRSPLEALGPTSTDLGFRKA